MSGRRAEVEGEGVQRCQAMGRVATRLAQELNHLLTELLLSATLARTERESPELLLEHLGRVELTTLRAAEAIKRLSAFASPAAPEPPRTVLGSLVREQCGSLMRLLGDDVELVLELAEEPAPIGISRAEVTQLLIHLLVNAREAMPLGGKLVIETGSGLVEGRQTTVLRVSDTGVGMTPEAQGKIFDPFFTTKQGVGGRGLGLCHVRAIVERAHGHLHVVSRRGSGTTFELHFPVAPPVVRRCGAETSTVWEAARLRLDAASLG